MVTQLIAVHIVGRLTPHHHKSKTRYHPESSAIIPPAFIRSTNSNKHYKQSHA
jgi:hypothetical protein